MLKSLFWTVVTLGLFATVLVLYWALRDMPDLQTAIAEGNNPSRYTQVLADNGEPILSYEKYHHKPVALSEISPNVVKALLPRKFVASINTQGWIPLAWCGRWWSTLRVNDTRKGPAPLPSSWRATCTLPTNALSSGKFKKWPWLFS